MKGLTLALHSVILRIDAFIAPVLLERGWKFASQLRIKNMSESPDKSQIKPDEYKTVRVQKQCSSQT